MSNASKFLLLCVWQIATLVQAAAPSQEMAAAIVRINNGDSAGTGCLVGVDDQSGLVVTCFHLFSDGDFGPIVTFPNGERYSARIVASDRTNDLTAMVIAKPSTPPVPLADYRPAKGETLHSAGYGGTGIGGLYVNTGVVTHYADTGGETYNTVKLTGTVRSGDSGGPIFNESGELAAVIWGGSPEGVYGTGSHSVGVMLSQCPGGTCPPYRIRQPQVRPITVRPAQPPVQPQQPAAKPCNCDNAALIARIDKLELQIATMAAYPPLPGPVGQTGPAGPKGDRGAPAQVNAAELAKQLPPITFEIWNDGKLIPGGTRKVNLGGTLPLERYLIGGK